MQIATSLLLVVDVQNGFINQKTAPVISQINDLIRQWEDRQWPIVCSRFINVPDSNFVRLRDWRAMQHEPETLLNSKLKTTTPFIFKKSTYSAWSSEVQALCVSKQIQNIVIVGVDTNECVLATALSVFDAGYTPWVVEDACASSGGREAHELAIQLLKPLLGSQQIVASKELLN